MLAQRPTRCVRKPAARQPRCFRHSSRPGSDRCVITVVRNLDVAWPGRELDAQATPPVSQTRERRAAPAKPRERPMAPATRASGKMMRRVLLAGILLAAMG